MFETQNVYMFFPTGNISIDLGTKSEYLPKQLCLVYIILILWRGIIHINSKAAVYIVWKGDLSKRK